MDHTNYQQYLSAIANRMPPEVFAQLKNIIEEPKLTTRELGLVLCIADCYQAHLKEKG